MTASLWSDYGGVPKLRPKPLPFFVGKLCSPFLPPAASNEDTTACQFDVGHLGITP